MRNLDTIGGGGGGGFNKNRYSGDIFNVLSMEKDTLKKEQDRINNESKEEKLLNMLDADEKEEYQKLKGLENFSKLVGKDLQEKLKQKLGEYRKRLGEGAPQDLEDFRKQWKENIEYLDSEKKKRIIEASEKIPVKVTIEADGSRVIEMEVGGYNYTILDVNIGAHSDDKFKTQSIYDLMTKEEVMLGGMRGNDVNEWKNQELKKYVRNKEEEGFQVPTDKIMESLFDELGEKAGLEESLHDEIAMFMYLTGMHGWYWLDEKKEGEVKTMRNMFNCIFDDDDRQFYRAEIDEISGKLCMIKVN